MSGWLSTDLPIHLFSDSSSSMEDGSEKKEAWTLILPTLLDESFRGRSKIEPVWDGLAEEKSGRLSPKYAAGHSDCIGYEMVIPRNRQDSM